MSLIPGIKKLRFFEKKWFSEALGALPPIVALGVTAYNDSKVSEKATSAWILGGAAVWLTGAGIVKVIQARVQDRENKHLRDHDGLHAALCVLYGCLSKHLSIEGDERGKLRITIMRVVSTDESDGSSEELEQLLPYVGGDGGKAGRKHSIHLGITGAAVRNKAIYAASRQNDDHETFIRELVANWGYTVEGARLLTADRQSWMAVPINKEGDGSVVAVVYLDSNVKKLFTQPIQKLVINSCSGIASYISGRYR